MVSLVLLSLSALVAVCNGGFLGAPYFGEPITSAASPYIHGFANPVFHAPQPIRKSQGTNLTDSIQLLELFENLKNSYIYFPSI